MSCMCRHIVDGKEDAADWARGRQSAARWSERICGVHVWKSSRRRQRRAGHRSEEGTAPPTQGVTYDMQGVRWPVEERAGVALHLCAVPSLGALCPGRHQE
ncbi:hypothetical protein TcCL_Unassigned02981 [Trypanosoma cruzi]|nr:hypothetical protein TcCL_Unassigned02981 [Trypanosoma cruzi]